MERNNRILIADDYSEIHEIMKLVLLQKNVDNNHNQELDHFEFQKNTFSTSSQEKNSEIYQIDSAYQGNEAYEMVLNAIQMNKPYALIFMDIRMPPGWSGLETIKKIFQIAPETEVVIITAYSDYSWKTICDEIKDTKHLHYLRKPFELTLIKKMTSELIKKWNLDHQEKSAA